MNKTKKIIIGGLLAFGGITGFAQQISPMTQAMLNSYESLLAENPKDYLTLYQRAMLYYNQSQYDRAMLDLEEALKYTPQKEKELRGNEYSLLSDIYIEQKEYEKAYSAVKSALELDPSSYPLTYKLGNICLYLKKPEEAYKAFQNMQRMQSRSQEAFFGMAKADIMLGNTKEAETLMNEAEKADPTNYVTYCRLGDLYQDMKQNEKAATNYLIAYQMTDNTTRPLESLLNLFEKDPQAVMNAIDYTISLSGANLSLLVMKATLAYQKGDYQIAEDTYKQILSTENGNEASIYNLLALTQKALNQPQEALSNVEKALGMNPASKDFLNTKSQVLLMTNPADALVAAEKAMAADNQDVESIMNAARAAVMTGNKEKAQQFLNMVVMYDPSNVEALLLRGYVNETLAKDEKQAKADYTRAASIDTKDFPDAMYLAIAKNKAGKTMDAEGIILDNLKNHPGNPEALYYAAVYYAQTGNLEKAADNAKKAVEAGYSNQYNLKASKEPFNNLQPIEGKF